MIAGVVIAALLALAAPPGAAGDLLSPAAFRDRLAAAISARGRPVMTVNDRTLRTKTAGGVDETISIDNIYAQYLGDPGRLDWLVDRLVANLLSGSVKVDDPIERLVVIVRPTDYIRRSVAPGASLSNFLQPRPMAGDLSFFLAVDSDQTIRVAGPQDLKRWNIDEAAAWDRAIANIKPRLGPLVMVHLGSEDGQSGLGADSGLAPSILAEPDLCSPSSPGGARNQIVLLYTRDMFLFAIPADHKMTARFWKMVAEEVAAGRSLSSTPLTCRKGKWVVASPPAG